MKFQRAIESTFVELANQYPVVTLMGPRQSGKTTLVRNLFPNKHYVNLEEPDTREFILNDPRKFFADNPQGAILDEVQRAPELLSYIQSIVDERQENGLFIVTGSHQLQVHQAITQSLAGRTAVLELLPLSTSELTRQGINLTVDEYLLNGFYPAIYSKTLNPTITYRNYFKTYVERDVRLIVNIKELVNFQRFIKLAAGRIGSILKIDSLAGDVGVTHNTIKNWFSILEASYLTYRLQPYYENFGKRLIKSSKLYFNDVGLVSYLLGIENISQLARDPLRGSLFENFILFELIKLRYNQGKEPHFYYYRDNHNNEIDIIIKHRNYLIPIEIKSTSTFNSALLKNLKFYQRLVGERMPFGFLVYSGETQQKIHDFHIINHKNLDKIYQHINDLD